MRERNNGRLLDFGPAQRKGRKVFCKTLLHAAFVFEFDSVNNPHQPPCGMQPDDKTKQYFIALIPPSPIYEQAWAQKVYFRDNYNSKASLNSPPHITLHMPFRWKEAKEKELINALKSFVCRFDPMKICLDSFGAFSPKVIFMDVVSTPALESLQKSIHKFCKTELNVFNANYKDRAFHPHVTLAFRDLKKPNFKKAWDEFQTKDFKAEFIADKISLLKHNGKIWEVLKDFNLESSYTINNTQPLAATEG
jgi:2'-5' RNA ligase